ncbi:MAG: hypothetical protein P1U68_18190 [Verrucomicrobiales bacterium]|nr:hypothetical protein [Verrucomicrobiales bacterium]
MRLPFTLSELSVIRSGGRVFVQLFGVGTVLLGLWGATVILDRTLETPEDADESPGAFDSELPPLTFPCDATLRHRDGRTIDATLISRPTPAQLAIQRQSDGRTFILELDTLAPSSSALAQRLPDPAPGRPFTSAVHPFETPLTPPGSRFTFPHYCTLVNDRGITLPVTLLRRETEDSIKVRRRKDGQLFTILLDQLVASDRELIRQFPLLSDMANSPDLSDGLSLP